MAAIRRRFEPWVTRNAETDDVANRDVTPSDRSARTKGDPNRGIDFEEAQELWLDSNHIEIPLPFEAEPRLAVIGRINSKIWTAIVTQRGVNIRIISVRRAHPKEEKIYEQG